MCNLSPFANVDDEYEKTYDTPAPAMSTVSVSVAVVFSFLWNPIIVESGAVWAFATTSTNSPSAGASHESWRTVINELSLVSFNATYILLVAPEKNW
jgi:hypothetical protein